MVVVNSWGCPKGDSGAVWVSAPFGPSLLLGGILAFPKGPRQSSPDQMPPGRWAARMAGDGSPASELDLAVVLGCCRAEPRLSCRAAVSPQSQLLAPLPRSAECPHPSLLARLPRRGQGCRHQRALGAGRLRGRAGWRSGCDRRLSEGRVAFHV